MASQPQGNTQNQEISHRRIVEVHGFPGLKIQTWGTRHIIILGEDELQSGILTVKNFATGIQTKVPRAELAVFLSN